jgi:hypothetical protein
MGVVVTLTVISGRVTAAFVMADGKAQAGSGSEQHACG